MKDNANISEMATEAIERLLMNDDIANMKESLDEFFFAWLVSDDDHSLEERRQKLCHFLVIRSLLKEAQKIRDKIE